MQCAHAQGLRRAGACSTGRVARAPAALLSSVRRPGLTAARAAAEQQATITTAEIDADPSLTRVTLRKPVGVVFAEAPSSTGGGVFIESVTAGGNADKSGGVKAGDKLVWCSAIVLKAGKEGLYEKQGHGARPYDNFENILFDCRGQDFKTVMSALKSNNERWGILDVTLVLQRPEGAASSATA